MEKYTPGNCCAWWNYKYFPPKHLVILDRLTNTFHQSIMSCFCRIMNTFSPKASCHTFVELQILFHQSILSCFCRITNTFSPKHLVVFAELPILSTKASGGALWHYPYFPAKHLVCALKKYKYFPAKLNEVWHSIFDIFHLKNSATNRLQFFHLWQVQTSNTLLHRTRKPTL